VLLAALTESAAYAGGLRVGIDLAPVVVVAPPVVVVAPPVVVAPAVVVQDDYVYYPNYASIQRRSAPILLLERRRVGLGAGTGGCHG